MTATVTLTLRQRVEVSPVRSLPPAILARLERELAFTNPIWEERCRRGYSLHGIPRIISGLETHGDRLSLPRGFVARLAVLLQQGGVSYRLRDRRWDGPILTTAFQGQLRDFQQEALRTILRRDLGVVEAPTGSGKTVLALAAVAARRQATLVVVPTRELVFQWQQRCQQFLPSVEVGLWTSGLRHKSQRLITIATVNSILRSLELLPSFGFLIVDECHHTPARTFLEVAAAFGGRYTLGLSATPYRRDGLTPLIHWYLGPTIYRISSHCLEENGHIVPYEVCWHPVPWRQKVDVQQYYSRAMSLLTRDPERNLQIVEDVYGIVQDPSATVLVLTDRREHCNTLTEMLAARGVTVMQITGRHRQKYRVTTLTALHEGRVQVLVATGQLIGEGFDCQRLTHVVLTMPIRFSGRLKQYLGRVLRPAPEKTKAVVHDYVDLHPVLLAAAQARARVYGCPLPEEIVDSLVHHQYANALPL